MNGTLAILGSAIFIALGLWHFYWALGGTLGKDAAIPEVDGKPAFTPSVGITVLVAVVLLAFALLVAVTADLVELPLPRSVLVWSCYGLAFGLFARAIGEFRLVGFFKRIKGSAFARMDTWVYSPLCLFLSYIAFAVGNANP